MKNLHWLAPAEFAEPEKARRSRMMHLLLIMLVSGAVVIAAANALDSQGRSAVTMLLGGLVMLFCLWLNRMGYVDLAGSVAILVFVGAISHIIFHSRQGIHDTAMLGYPILIMISSLLLGRRTYLVIIAFCILLLGVVIYAELNGMTPSAFRSATSPSDFIVLAIILLMTAMTMRLLVDNLLKSLRDVQQKSQALAESNQELLERSQQLEQERNFVAQVMDTSPAGIVRIDAEGQVVFANARAEQVLGLSQGGITSQQYNSPEWQITAADGSEFPAEQLPFAVVRATLRPAYDVRHSIRWPSGRMAHLSVNAAPLLDEKGGFAGAIASIEDITERQVADMALRNSEAELRALFAAMNDVIIVLDKEGRYVRIAPTNPSLLYLPPEKLVGRKLHEVLPAEIADQFLAIILDALRTGQPATVEYSLPIDGREVWFVASVAPMFTDRVIWVARDITSRKTAEAEIQALNSELEQRVRERTTQLEQANRELEAFSYSVSHDLRAPLRGIDGFSRILLEDYAPKLDENARGYIDRIRAGAQKMGKLIDDLLAFSRLGRQAVRPRYISSVELSRMVADIVADMNAAWPGRSIQVMQAELPGCEADPALLRHVWFNLISNAYKYTQTRTAANIEIGYQIERSEVSYYVKDNGVGFNMSTSFLAFSSACILMSNSTAPGSAWPSSSALSSGMAGAFGRKPAWVREPPFGFTSNRLWPSDVLQKIYSGMNSA